MTLKKKLTAKQFMAKVNKTEVFVARATGIHEAYVKKALAEGWTRGPRDNAAKTKPNICPFGELSLAIQASNTGPLESIFGYVNEQIDVLGIVTLADLRAYVLTLLNETGDKVPSRELGERTWKVWAGYAREAEPTHPNLVDTYDELDAGTKDYDLGLNALAVKYLVELIDAETN